MVPHDSGMDTVLVESCVDTLESALAAQAGGADRIELCDNLAEGGTSPSAGMIALCCERLSIPVFVIIRPRGGDFVYSADELDVMLRDIRLAAELGAAGVVFGALMPDGSVDTDDTRKLIEAARPMSVTFHRAFDACRNAEEALESLIALGVDRVLTSGRAATAPQGADCLRSLVRQAAGRIIVLAGGGVREHNVEQLVSGTGVREVHVRLLRESASPMTYVNPAVDFGGRTAPSDRLRAVTDSARIAKLRRLALAAVR
jgi:copper homeostasis protein